MSGNDQPLLMSVRQEQGSVFLGLSTGEVLELATDSVPDRLPSVGESLDHSLLFEIQGAAERKKIARRLFSLLDRRLQPVARTRDKLLEEGFSAVGIEAVLEQLSTRGLYSDRTFAEAWCRDCLMTRAVGRSYLISKLRGKRVPGPIAVGAVEAVLDPELEAELARTAAARKWGHGSARSEASGRSEPTGYSNRPDRKAEAKVIRFLQGRGFNTGLAVRAARETWPGAQFEEES